MSRGERDGSLRPYSRFSIPDCVYICVCVCFSSAFVRTRNEFIAIILAAEAKLKVRRPGFDSRNSFLQSFHTGLDSVRSGSCTKDTESSIPEDKAAEA
jgi:hypothetical protein